MELGEGSGSGGGASGGDKRGKLRKRLESFEGKSGEPKRAMKSSGS